MIPKLCVFFKTTLLLTLMGFAAFPATLFSMGHNINRSKYTAIDEAVSKYGLKTEPELRKFFLSSGVAYPPQAISLLAFKKERCIELWARNKKNIWRYIHTYPMTAFSGHLGPKLRENDGQIPEGIYHLTDFNPFSSMHLSLLIDYPNDFDRLQAAKESRRHLGNNIFLHGKALSAGCLAVGNTAIDQLFLLAHRVGLSHINLIIAPNDLRIAKPATSLQAQPSWLPLLYADLKQALRPFQY